MAVQHCAEIRRGPVRAGPGEWHRRAVHHSSGTSLGDPLWRNCAVPGPGGTYTVQRGDTIYSIARKLGKTPSAIINANNLVNANFIFPGQVLRIP